MKRSLKFGYFSKSTACPFLNTHNSESISSKNLFSSALSSTSALNNKLVIAYYFPYVSPWTNTSISNGYPSIVCSAPNLNETLSTLKALYFSDTSCKIVPKFPWTETSYPSNFAYAWVSLCFYSSFSSS